MLYISTSRIEKDKSVHLFSFLLEICGCLRNKRLVWSSIDVQLLPIHCISLSAHQNRKGQILLSSPTQEVQSTTQQLFTIFVNALIYCSTYDLCSRSAVPFPLMGVASVTTRHDDTFSSLSSSLFGVNWCEHSFTLLGNLYSYPVHMHKGGSNWLCCCCYHKNHEISNSKHLCECQLAVKCQK